MVFSFEVASSIKLSKTHPYHVICGVYLGAHCFLYCTIQSHQSLYSELYHSGSGDYYRLDRKWSKSVD